MSIKENSYYSHSDWGEVKVIEVTDTEVQAQTNKTKFVADVGNVPLVKTEEKEDFKEKSEPADVGISTPKSNVEYELNELE
jgi:hypothetical protein